MVIGKVAPINYAYYVEANNSFVVTCRLSQATTGQETDSTCDFLIDLNQVYALNQSNFDLFTNNSEQWILIRSNMIKSNEMSGFPSYFNRRRECLTLRWYTHYSDISKELQFRILIFKNFSKNMTQQKCTLHRWNSIYPQFMESNDTLLSFRENYIEIRFSGHEHPIDEENAILLREKVQWQFVSMEITHIYRHQSDKPTYYIVTDITDGFYRWYVWKTSLTIQTFLNETLKSLSYQFDHYKFKLSDHFAQITSMLLTQRAHHGFSIPELKEILTTSDPLQSSKSDHGQKRVDGKMEWISDINVWDSDVMQIKRISNINHVIPSNHICVEIESFVVQYNPNARGIKRKIPKLPVTGYRSPIVSDSSTIRSMEHLQALPFVDSGSAELSSRDSDEDTQQTHYINNNYTIRSQEECRQFPVFLQIRGPDIVKKGKLHISKRRRPEIFRVPRRGEPLQYTSSYGRTKKEKQQSISGHYADTPDLIPSVINLIDPGQQQQQQMRVQKVSHETTQITPVQQIVYIVLYDGYDYGREAQIISATMFIMIFILSCIGFSCIIIEETQIKRRTSSSSSISSLFSLHSHSANSKIISTPPKRRRKIDL